MTMTNDTRQAHLAYLAKSFVVAHEIAEGLGPEGTATLRKYGCWYEALDKGNLSAISESNVTSLMLCMAKQIQPLSTN